MRFRLAQLQAADYAISGEERQFALHGCQAESKTVPDSPSLQRITISNSDEIRQFSIHFEGF